MNTEDNKTLQLIKELIKEVAQDIRKKKVLTESKTPEKISEDHRANIKEYVAKNVWETIKNSQK